MPNHKRKIIKNGENIDLLQKLEKQFDFGNGFTASLISHKNQDDQTGKVDMLYTNKAPKLKLKGFEIDIAYSSTEAEDDELLHFLSNKL